MAAFDTSVLVRVLAGDDPVQTRKAEAAFVAHAGREGVFISLVVLAELYRVLSSAYEWERDTLHERLSALIRTEGVVVEELELVQRALDQFETGKAGLADYLILERARGSGGGELVTFDKTLAKERQVTLLSSN